MPSLLRRRRRSRSGDSLGKRLQRHSRIAWFGPSVVVLVMGLLLASPLASAQEENEAPLDDSASTASSTTTNGLRPIRMVIVPKSMDNPFFDPSGDGCVDQAALLTRQNPSARPVECLYLGPGPAAADNEGKIQAQMVSDMMDSGNVDALSISVRNADVMTPVIDRAVAAGIPVVTFDSDAPTSKRSAYVGTDNFFFGTQIAKVLKQLSPAGGTYGLITSAESVNLQERVAGFVHEMEREGEKHPWTQVPGSPADIIGDIHVAMDKMQELANRNPPPTAIAPVMGAPMRSGSWKEFVDEHRAKNITLVAGDAMPNQLDFLSRRYCHGLVGQLPYEMGAISAQILYDLITKPDQPVQQTIVGTNVLTHIQVPLVLPAMKMDHNLIGSLHVIGFVLFGLVASMAVGFAVWVWRARHVHVVKVAQPSFLVMVAAGVMVMASALIPLSFDDNGGDTAENASLDDHSSATHGVLICMSIPWLASLGFTITFSALFSKTLRVTKIFYQAGVFARVRVQAKDVLVPFVVLFTANVIILTLWTILDPLRYVRQDLPGTDGWNRVISTYGSCRSDQVVYFLTPLAVVNISVLVLANYQAYQARMIQSEFAESKYIGMAMASLLQAMVSGIPILFVVRESPQAYYLVLAFMIFIICCAVLLLIFVPKMVLADKFSEKTDQEQQQHIMSVIRSTNADIQQGKRRKNSMGSSRNPNSSASTLHPAPNNIGRTQSSRTSFVGGGGGGGGGGGRAAIHNISSVTSSASLGPPPTTSNLNSSQISMEVSLGGDIAAVIGGHGQRGESFVGLERHPGGSMLDELRRYIIESEHERSSLSSFPEEANSSSSSSSEEEFLSAPPPPPPPSPSKQPQHDDASGPPLGAATQVAAGAATNDNNTTTDSEAPAAATAATLHSTPNTSADDDSSLSNGNADDNLMRDRLMNRLGATATKNPSYFM